MRGNTTGIDIGTETITAVQTGGGLKGRRILACMRIPLDRTGLEAALSTLVESMDLRSHAVMVTVPDDLVSFRNVAMPFGDVRKIRQALPFEVEGMLPYSVEDLLIDFLTTGDRPAGGVLAASVERNALSDYLTALQAHGIDPEVLEVRGSALASWVLRQPETPDHILVLEAGMERHTVILCLKRRIVLIRSFIGPSASAMTPDATDKPDSRQADLPLPDTEPFFRSLCHIVHRTVHAFRVSEGIPDRPEKLFFTGEPLQGPQSADLLSRYLDIPAEPIDLSQDRRVRLEEGIAGNWSPALMNGALSLALMDPVKGRGFNFRRDEFERESQYLQIRKAAPKAAIFLFLILSFLAADAIIDFYSLKKEYQSLDREITAMFRQTLPKVTRMIDPVQQLRVSVEEVKRSAVVHPAGKPESTVLDLLREISGRIPPPIHVQVYRMVVDPETVRLSGRTDAFNDVDRIKSELAAAKALGPVAITSANLDSTGKKVQFEISIERKR